MEDLRRRDPVKRAIGAGVLLLLGMLVWSSFLWTQAIITKSRLNSLEDTLNSRTNEYAEVVGNQKKLRDSRQKLASLQQLATNRFLNGTMLNALQQATIENVQLTRLRVDQGFVLTEGTKPTTNGTHVVPGKPATVDEKITLTLEARDSSSTPGESVKSFKDVIAGSPYFQDMMGKTGEIRLKDVGAPQNPPDGKPFLLFTLECRYPEKVR